MDSGFVHGVIAITLDESHRISRLFRPFLPFPVPRALGDSERLRAGSSSSGGAVNGEIVDCGPPWELEAANGTVGRPLMSRTKRRFTRTKRRKPSLFFGSRTYFRHSEPPRATDLLRMRLEEIFCRRRKSFTAPCTPNPPAICLRQRLRFILCFPRGRRSLQEDVPAPGFAPPAPCPCRAGNTHAHVASRVSRGRLRDANAPKV